MKRLLFIATLIIAAAGLRAQDDQELMQQAIERYKNITTLTAPVTQTRHNVALTADQVAKGMFYFKKPQSMVMTFNDGRDKLLMHGGQFTIVADGKATTASSGNEQLEALRTLLKNFTSGNADSDTSIEDLADIDAERDGSRLVLTITPRIADAKAKRKMLYRSFVVTLDTKEGALKSIRLNERGQNYTQYDFGRFTADAPVNDSVFAN